MTSDSMVEFVCNKFHSSSGCHHFSIESDDTMLPWMIVKTSNIKNDDIMKHRAIIRSFHSGRCTFLDDC
jgi:hypothetical protein